MYSYLASSQLLYFCMIVMNPGATRTTAPFQQVLPKRSIIYTIALWNYIIPASAFVLAHFHLQPDRIKRARRHPRSSFSSFCSSVVAYDLTANRFKRSAVVYFDLYWVGLRSRGFKGESLNTFGQLTLIVMGWTGLKSRRLNSTV